MPIWLGFEIPWKLRSVWNTFFSPRRSFWSFYRVQDPFSLYILVSDKKTYIWFNVSCNVWLCMNEIFEHLNLFFIWICFIPLSFFLVLTNAKCKYHAFSHADEFRNRPYQCNMQTLCPNMLLIDFETLTQMLIFLWMQAKCDASLDFWFWYKCFLTKMQMQFLMMQMSYAGIEMQSLFMMVLVRIFIPWCKCLLIGMSWYKSPLVGTQWCKWSDSNTNYSKIPFNFKMRFPQRVKPKCLQNSIYYFWKGHLFLLT